MFSASIHDVKSFMSHLLSKDSFDRFYLIEAAVKMGISYHIDGHLNRDFFDTDTQHSLKREYSYWKEVRPKVFDLIKGSRLPLGCKIILGLPNSMLVHFLETSGCSFREEDIEGMYINILYDPANLMVTTGISYRVFSMDKSLEHAFEDYVRSFLIGLGLR